ncbi:MAG TPA: methyltransferase domain-containing protein [Caldilineae bacterium]|nr:methyltransferase domain-containing protein [Caldilineae bacterium]
MSNSQSTIPQSSACPACNATDLSVFYEVSAAPVHSVLLHFDRDEALNYPTGDIRLAFCPTCGFISNIAFDPSLHEYSDRYEETQGFSPTFGAFHRRLAQHLIDRYDLHGKDILEIGCGKGEFLTLLCELGDNRGVGVDPAYVPGRLDSPAAGRITFIRDFYSERYAHLRADFVVCKMTLEHIPDVGEFVSMVRRAIGDRPDTTVFFQIPEIRRILRDLEFVDVYYEHCSYFSAGSLARLFRRSGFEVLDLWTDYDDQYLMIEARPAGAHNVHPHPREESVDALAADVAYFAANVQVELDKWSAVMQDVRESNRRAVVWGAGSKAVAFLTKLGVRDEIRYAVDINPHKHGAFLAGTGQEIVAPAFLRAYRPDLVIIMNPVYREEIASDLAAMGLEPEIRSV